MELKKLIDPSITEIVEQLQKAGYEAYIVGGAVRDLMLDRVPKDYDISTGATPEEIQNNQAVIDAYLGGGEEL